MLATYAPVMPAGYFSRHSRNEFGEPCISLHCERVGWLSDHDCEADAIYAAQACAAEAADALAEQEADYRAESDMLDRIYREVSRRYDCDLPETDPRNRAVRLALEALDGISKPVADDVREAA